MSAQVTTKKNILVICSHSESSDWSRDMLQSLYTLDLRRNDTEIFIYYLKITSLPGVDALNQSISSLFAHFQNSPDLVILVGGSSFSLIPDVNMRWEGVPIILCGENDYVCKREYIIYGEPDKNALRMPFSYFHNKYNVSLIYTPTFVEKTLDMMVDFIPKMEKLVFIGGENFQSREAQMKVERVLERKYPDITFERLVAHEMSADSLMELSKTIDKTKVGVVFASWLTHNKYLQNISNRQNILRYLDGYLPIFSMFKLNDADMEYVSGLCTHDRTVYETELNRQIDMILDGKCEARDIPMFNGFSPTYMLNVRSFEAHGMNMEKTPVDAILYNVEMSFFEEYKDDILISFILFFILVLAIIALLLYISREKQMKERERNSQYEYLVENMPIAYTRVKPKRNAEGEIIDALIVHANKAFRNSVGINYNPVGMSYNKVNPSRLTQLIAATKGREIIYKDSTEKYLELVSNSLDIDKYLDTFGFDITELNKAKVKAEESDRLKSLFLANMSHEIRTPLNAILGFAQLMNSEGASFSEEEYTMFNDLIHKNGQILLKIIDDVLDLSMIESGHYVMNIIEVDLNAICQDAVNSLRSKAPEGVSVVFEKTCEYLYVKADPKRVQQVLMQLIANALKHTSQGEVKVVYDFVGIDSIRVNVVDTGEGISSEDLPHIFERFYKGATFAQGTGLGLTICKVLVELWGGEINVESTLGKGSCFWFTLKE